MVRVLSAAFTVHPRKLKAEVQGSAQAGATDHLTLARDKSALHHCHSSIAWTNIGSSCVPRVRHHPKVTGNHLYVSTVDGAGGVSANHGRVRSAVHRTHTVGQETLGVTAVGRLHLLPPGMFEQTLALHACVQQKRCVALRLLSPHADGEAIAADAE